MNAVDLHFLPFSAYHIPPFFYIEKRMVSGMPFSLYVFVS